MATKKTGGKAAEKTEAKKPSAKLPTKAVAAAAAPLEASKAAAPSAAPVETKLEPIVAAEIPAVAATITVRKVSPSREAIARRAFELFALRGGTNGHAFEDWIRAERELIAD